MRTAVYLSLLALTAVAVSQGSLRVALVIAATKAALVGGELMELRHAHRAYGALFATGLGGLVLVLSLLAAPR